MPATPPGIIKKIKNSLNRNIDIPPEELEIIERYILKQMPQDEYEEFTKKLKGNESLNEKIETVRLLLVGIQEAELTNKIQDFHKGLPFFKQKKTWPSAGVFFMKKWLVAASVIVLVGLGALLFFNQFNKHSLFNKYYKPDPGLITAMGTSDNYLFDNAMIDYKTKKYDKAITAWEKLLAAKPENDTLHYFIGSALLAENKSEEAISHFQKVILNTHSYFLNDAYWYLGLALVKQQKTKKAISFIEKSNHQNKEMLLLKLKR